MGFKLAFKELTVEKVKNDITNALKLYYRLLTAAEK